MREQPPYSPAAAVNEAARWQGAMRLGLGWGLFTGAAGHNTAHAHHAVQLVLSCQALSLWVDEQALPPCCGAIIGADVPHRLAAGEAAVTLLYVEPDSAAGRALAARLHSGWCALTAAETKAALLACGADDPARAVSEALLLDRDAAVTSHGDALIETLIAGLPPVLSTRLSIASRAKAARLSPSRLQHRFRAHTGMAFRPYLRWRRLLTALGEVRDGSTLTDAALAAGFADAAHFSRTLRRHFGVTPRVLLGLR